MGVGQYLMPLDRLADPLPIAPLARAFEATITPPGSKSLTNRALLLAALGSGTSILRNALTEADDAQVMVRALRSLGAAIDVDQADTTTLRITGVNGRWKLPETGDLTLNLHNAGTATRFLAAAATLPSHANSNARIVIDGDARMRERPIGELVEALRSLGTRVDDLGKPGYPPIRVYPNAALLSKPAEIAFGRTSSSQFISALMLIAPWLPHGLTVRFTQAPTSEPYIAMTLNLLSRLGVKVVDERPQRLFIGSATSNHTLPAFDLDIEPDASGATYPLAAAAIIPGARVRIPNLAADRSLQGDIRFIEVLEEFGATVRAIDRGIELLGPSRLCPVDLDLSGMPDTAMTAAVVACFTQPAEAHGQCATTLRGLRTLRVKESDRLSALAQELAKIGAQTEVFEDRDDLSLRITPGPSLLSLHAGSPLHRGDAHTNKPTATMPETYPPVILETYKDHRLAMAFSLIGLRRPNVLIRDPRCVEKTYPSYWKHFAAFYADQAALP